MSASKWSEEQARDAMTKALGDRPDWFDDVKYGVSMRVGRYILDLRAEARREAFSEMEKAFAALLRYEVGGECDGESGRCYAEMELDDKGRYVGLDDIAAALRAKADAEAPHE